MRTRVSRLFLLCSLAASLAASSTPASAQQLIPPQQSIQFRQPTPPAAPVALPPATEQVSIAAEALPTEVSSLLQKGGSLESTGHWAEALSFYDEALHEHPEDAALTGRFDVARLHYSLEQRYDDRSFRDSLASLKGHEATELYDDLLTKINAHYYTDPAVAIAGSPRWPIARHRARRQDLPHHQRHPRQLRPNRTAPRQTSATDQRRLGQLAQRRRQRRHASRATRQSLDRPQRKRRHARVHLGGRRRTRSLLRLPHRRSAPRHLFPDRRQLCRPRRRAQSRQGRPA